MGKESCYESSGTGNMLGKRLADLVQKEPLLLSSDSAEWDKTKASEKKSTVFLGIGICSRNGDLSVGLPFDAVGYLASAEYVRRSVGIDTCAILVADEHAAANTNHSSLNIQAQTEEVMRQTRAICAALSVPASIVRGSEIAEDEYFQQIYRYVTTTVENDYARREIADIAWMQKNHGDVIKLGWLMGKGGTSDEAWFDAQFQSARRLTYRLGSPRFMRLVVALHLPTDRMPARTPLCQLILGFEFP